MAKVVVLDAMGVIYKAGDDVGELLIPFARRNGSDAPDSVIGELYLDCSLGDSTPKKLWRALSLWSDDRDLDTEYLKGHELTPGLLNFLKSMLAKNIPVACISNDVAEWSAKLRKMHGLEEYISSWTISGDVGFRKPNEEIFEHFARATGFLYGDCLFIDDRVRNLDAARELGFQTLLYSADSSPSGFIDHPMISSFHNLADNDILGNLPNAGRDYV